MLPVRLRNELVRYVHCGQCLSHENRLLKRDINIGSTV